MNVPIVVTVHPINTDAHPTVPPGFRWAVDWCGQTLNAGWEPSRQSATMAGEAAMVCAVKAARLCGCTVGFDVVQLDTDPVPAGLDAVSILEG